jgi:hypothetical protein
MIWVRIWQEPWDGKTLGGRAGMTIMLESSTGYDGDQADEVSLSDHLVIRNQLAGARGKNRLRL